MIFSNVPFRTLIVAPVVGSSTGHGFPLPTSLCTVPSGQNSSVTDALNVTFEGSVRTAPSWFGRVTGSLSFAGYFHFVSLHRSLALSFASGLLGLPINSTTRYLPVSGQLKRIIVLESAETHKTEVLHSKLPPPSFVRIVPFQGQGHVIRDGSPVQEPRLLKDKPYFVSVDRYVS